MNTTQGTIQGAGKKSTQEKRKIYGNPLPIGHSSVQRNRKVASRSWWDWFNEWANWIHESISPSPPLYVGWYDPVTRSVWMYDQGDALKLWTQGFFGKGSLSRSEPTWTSRRIAEKEARQRGIITAEQMTQRRREERRLLKIERARAAVRAGIQLPDGITALGGELRDDDTLGRGADGELWRGDEDKPIVEAGVSRIKGLKYFSDDIQSTQVDTDEQEEHAEEEEEEDGQDVEHFQLTMIEAFFLAAMLGCLEVHDVNGHVRANLHANQKCLSLDTLYQLCMISYLPRFDAHNQLKWVRPDNPFLLSYVVYHHFRSLGWVVKSGTKFCVDFLLYKRGPVFSHAEFSVLVIPEYENEQDREGSPFMRHHNAGEKSWIWFSMMNRVNTQVQKVRLNYLHGDTCLGTRVDSPRQRELYRSTVNAQRACH